LKSDGEDVLAPTRTASRFGHVASAGKTHTQDPRPGEAVSLAPKVDIKGGWKEPSFLLANRRCIGFQK
jgi:hypothetical protein